MFIEGWRRADDNPLFRKPKERGKSEHPEDRGIIK